MRISVHPSRVLPTLLTVALLLLALAPVAQAAEHTVNLNSATNSFEPGQSRYPGR